MRAKRELPAALLLQMGHNSLVHNRMLSDPQMHQAPVRQSAHTWRLLLAAIVHRAEEPYSSWFSFPFVSMCVHEKSTMLLSVFGTSVRRSQVKKDVSSGLLLRVLLHNTLTARSTYNGVDSPKYGLCDLLQNDNRPAVAA